MTDHTDKRMLYELWHHKTLTRAAIADRCEVASSTVQHWLLKYGIQKGYNDPRVVQYLYCDQEWSSADIADHFNCSPTSVRRTLHEHDIETNRVGQPRRDGVGIVVRDGYVRWQNQTTVGVHQLVMIADGADPQSVFSDGEYEVHHKNHIPFDNRPSNLELMESSAHSELHYNGEGSVA